MKASKKISNNPKTTEVSGLRRDWNQFYGRLPAEQDLYFTWWMEKLKGMLDVRYKQGYVDGLKRAMEITDEAIKNIKANL
jgi:hypothetical protein